MDSPQHEFCLITLYCVHCGMGKMAAENPDSRPCFRDSKIVAMSHRRAEKIIKAFADRWAGVVPPIT